MSGKLTGMVFDRYPEGGGEMLLALKLADNAHDDGTHIFPSVDTMAEKTRQSRRAVQYQLKRMRESGWLILVRAARGGRENAGRPAEYRINPEWIKGADFASLKPAEKGAEIAPNKSEKGANHDTNGCNPEQERVQNEAEKGATAIAPEPSVNPHEPSVNRAQARDGETPPAPTAEEPPSETEVPGFERFWAVWPAASGRKQAREICLAHWIANGLEADKHLIVAHVEAMKRTQHWKTGGDPTPIRYLEGRRWRDCSPDEIAAASASAQEPDDGTPWYGTPEGVDARARQREMRARKPDEDWRSYRVLVVKAENDRRAAEFVLKDAQRFNDSRLYQFARQTFGDALMPADDYAS